MKKPLILFIPIFFLLVTSFLYPGPTDKIQILDAMEKGMVKIEVKGVGGHSGACLLATITNLVNEKIAVVIPAGTVFIPENDEMQDILVVRESIYVLNKKQSKESMLTGFCSSSSKKSPPEGMAFKPARPANEKLALLAEFINKNNFEEDAVQSAIWTVSDGHPIAEIYHENPKLVQPLREEASRLSGQPMVWYSTRTERDLDMEGYIRSQPTLVTGEITVVIEKPCTMQQEVFDSNHNSMWKIKDMNVPQAGKITYDFQLRVQSWPKGDYYVKVSIPGKVILKQDFSI